MENRKQVILMEKFFINIVFKHTAMDAGIASAGTLLRTLKRIPMREEYIRRMLAQKQDTRSRHTYA